jgi:hypothetical protein
VHELKGKHSGERALLRQSQSLKYRIKIGLLMSNDNFLLSALKPEDRKFLVSRSTLVVLPLRTPLYEANEFPAHACFLTSGLASVVTTMPDGATAEVSFIGRDGVVGAFHILGPAGVPTNCFLQMAGGGA